MTTAVGTTVRPACSCGRIQHGTTVDRLDSMRKIGSDRWA